MSFLLRLARLLAISIWVGGLVLFAFALAPTAFHTLPVREAGLVVGGVLKVWHAVAVVCGALFLLATLVLLLRARVRLWFWAELALVAAMLLTTLYLQRHVLPAMDADQRHAGGDVNAVALTDPARVDFDRLHHASEQLEGGVLLVGLCVLGLLAAETA